MTNKFGAENLSHCGGGAVDACAFNALVFDIKRFAIHDGPGIRTTVFFKGCPLSCKWCHNPESWSCKPEISFQAERCIACGECVASCPEKAILVEGEKLVTDSAKCKLCGKCAEACVSDARQMLGRVMSVEEILEEVEKDVVFYDESGGGVTFSGGEPLQQSEVLCKLLEECKKRGIHTAVDTSCHACGEVIEKIFGNADLFLCDVKHMDSDAHRRLTGVGNEQIIQNIKRLAESDTIIRIPVIPGFNDDGLNIDRTATFLTSLEKIKRVDILPYHTSGVSKLGRLLNRYNLLSIEKPTNGSTEKIADRFRSLGFRVKVGG